MFNSNYSMNLYIKEIHVMSSHEQINLLGVKLIHTIPTIISLSYVSRMSRKLHYNFFNMKRVGKV